MATPSDVDRVIEQLRAGDSRAAEELFVRFADQLRRLVQAKLGWRYRRKFDADDVVQSVFKSFIRLQAAEQLAFESWDALWGLLSLIAIRKCGHRLEYLRAAKRDVARERSGHIHADDLERSRAELQAFARDPTPSDAAILAETLARLMGSIDDRERQIATLALQGYTTSEISTQVGRSERTVQRVLLRIREELRHSAEDD
jgi:RNA polymerase sigma-70 factor (ECF subfamily)